MKNKKIKLEDLKVKSFITKKESVDKATIKGGEDQSNKRSECEVCTFVWCTTTSGDFMPGGGQ